MRSVGVPERRARLGIRHHLGSPAPDPVGATTSVVCLHSSDPATVFLSVWARVDGFEVGHLEDALYEERSLVRMHGMRRTLWVVPRDEVEVVESSTTRQIAERERRSTIRILEEGGVADDASTWLDDVSSKILSVVESEGPVLTRDLTTAIPELDVKITFHNKAGRPVGSTGVGSRLLLQLSMESRLFRARPTGSWLSSQYRWATTEDWLGEPVGEMPREHAAAHLVHRCLHAFGPASETDLKWWTGWPVTRVRKALADVDAVEVDLAGQTGYLLPDDLDPVEPGSTWVALRPSLDPTTMGWKERDWYLGTYQDRLFDRNGNAGATVWVDGRIVGGWRTRLDGEVAYELFEDVGSDARAALDARAVELQGWLGDLTVSPRFRSPHHETLGP